MVAQARARAIKEMRRAARRRAAAAKETQHLRGGKAAGVDGIKVKQTTVEGSEEREEPEEETGE
jgi:hypothetical protein